MEMRTPFNRICKSRLTALLLLVPLVLAACDGESTSPRIPASLEAVAGAGGTATVGSTVTLTVQVEDGAGSPMSEVPVNWQIVTGDGSLSSASSTTNSEGRASTTWTLGTKAGVQSVRASVEGVSAATFQATATPGALAAVAADPSEIRMTELYQTAELSADGVDEYGNAISGVSIAWSSLDTTVVSVSESGEITALKNGETQVVASSGAFADTVDVVVDYPKLASIEITADRDTILVESTLQLTATGLDEKGAPYKAGIYEWSSSDTTTAVVDQNGLVTSRAGGVVTITALADEIEGEFELLVRGRLHSGRMSTDEVWLERDNPHWVTDDIWVYGSESPRLTLEAGVEVRFHKDASIRLGYASTAGNLEVQGTVAKPVLFTSDKDSPAAGDWGGIRFESNAASDSRISHATVEYCGVGSIEACLAINGARVTVEDVEVRHSSKYGVNVTGGGSFNATSKNLSVMHTADHAVRIGANQAGTLPEGGTFGGSGTNTVRVEGGDVSATQTWPNLGIPYHVAGRVHVYGSASPTLTIPAGTELRFASGAGFDISYASTPGTLKVDGTAADPVVMTTSSGTPQPGAWAGIRFGSSATLDSYVKHAEMAYCGSDQYDACLRIQSSTVAVQDVTIEKSGAYGVYLSNGGAFGTGSANLTVKESELDAVRIGANEAGTLPVGGTFVDNGSNTIRIDAGTVSRTQTWQNPGVPYLIGSGTVSIYGSNSPVLTIAPGVEVRMGNNAGIDIAYASTPGGLIAEGTAEAPILFTANTDSPQPGYWRSVNFTANALVDSRLSHVIFEYGTNSVHFRMLPGVALNNSTIRHASECGVRFQGVGSPPDLLDPALNNTFANNAANICH